MITLSPEAIDKIYKTKTLKLDIQVALDISHTTLYKYLKENDPKLTNMNVVNLLVKKTGLTKKELIAE